MAAYYHKDREARESHPKDYGLKYDQGKLRLDLIPPEIIEGLGQVFTLGAEKYGIGNWEKGFEPGQLLAAARRHDLALAKGEFIDPDSGLPHGFHAAWNYAVLTTLELRKERKGKNMTEYLYSLNGENFRYPHLTYDTIESARAEAIEYLWDEAGDYIVDRKYWVGQSVDPVEDYLTPERIVDSLLDSLNDGIADYYNAEEGEFLVLSIEARKELGEYILSFLKTKATVRRFPIGNIREYRVTEDDLKDFLLKRKD